MLPEIKLSKIRHRKQTCIALQFKYNEKLLSHIRTIEGSKWSKTKRLWYVPYSAEKLAEIRKTLNRHVRFTIASDLLQESTELHRKLGEKRTLTLAQRDILNAFYRYLKGKRYSQSTVETYSMLVADFIAFHTKKEVSSLTNRDVELFIERVYLARKYSISTQRQFISALKLFTVYYPETAIDNVQLERPKKDNYLPTVLSKNEVLRLIRHTKNLKHRAIIALIYSCGLRISELINLRIRDIDINRKQVLVKNAKGRKDRNVILAQSFLPLLQNYITTYAPEVFFAENSPGVTYSAGSVRKFIKRSAKAAGILKNVTPHTLRHSYATHLLENGIDLRYIQSLLGHAKPETTMIYTHVSKKDLLQIESPLDTMVKEYQLSGQGSQKVTISGSE